MMNADQIQRRINKLSAELKELRKKRRPRVRRPRSDRGRGRPAVPPETLLIAKELARTAPIADVADKVGVARWTLARYGITRKALDAERRRRELELSALPAAAV